MSENQLLIPAPMGKDDQRRAMDKVRPLTRAAVIPAQWIEAAGIGLHGLDRGRTARPRGRKDHVDEPNADRRRNEQCVGG